MALASGKNEADTGGPADITPPDTGRPAAVDATAAEVTPGGVSRKRTVKARDPRPKDATVGPALRSVYQQTVNEDIPDEMMQLLGKLS